MLTTSHYQQVLLLLAAIFVVHHSAAAAVPFSMVPSSSPLVNVTTTAAPLRRVKRESEKTLEVMKECLDTLLNEVQSIQQDVLANTPLDGPVQLKVQYNNIAKLLKRMINHMDELKRTYAEAKDYNADVKFLHKLREMHLKELKDNRLKSEDILSVVFAVEGGGEAKELLMKLLEQLRAAIQSAEKKLSELNDIFYGFYTPNRFLYSVWNALEYLPKQTFKALFLPGSYGKALYATKLFIICTSVVAFYDYFTNWVLAKTIKQYLPFVPEDVTQKTTTISTTVSSTTEADDQVASMNLTTVMVYLLVLLVIVTTFYFIYYNPFSRSDNKDQLRAKNVYLGKRLAEVERARKRKRSSKSRSSSKKQKQSSSSKKKPIQSSTGDGTSSKRVKQSSSSTV